jgi:hypothetical protein
MNDIKICRQTLSKFDSQQGFLGDKAYLIPLSLNTEEMFVSFLEFGNRFPLLSIPDRPTIAIARHQLLICARDDGLVVETCIAYDIAYTRTLRLLSEMVTSKHKTATEVIKMAES